MINVLTTLNNPPLSKGPGRPCTARRGLGRGYKKTRSCRWEEFAYSLYILIFLKLLTFNVAVVSWYFFFQEGAS